MESGQLISMDFDLNDNVKFLINIDFEHISKFNEYIINNDLNINLEDYIKLCVIKFEKNVFIYLMNFFIINNSNTNNIDIRYYLIFNTIIPKFLDDIIITSKDIDIDQYSIDNISYIVKLNNLIENYDYSDINGIYYLNIKSFINLYNNNLVSIKIKQTVIDYYFKYHMYYSHLNSLNFINLEFNSLNTENKIKTKELELKKIEDNIDIKNNKLNLLKNRVIEENKTLFYKIKKNNIIIDKDRKYIEQLRNNIIYNKTYLEKICKNIKNNNITLNLIKSDIKKQQIILDNLNDEINREKLYLETLKDKKRKCNDTNNNNKRVKITKRIVNNRIEYGTCIRNKYIFCRSKPCLNNSCNYIHINESMICPITMEGLICSGEFNKTCNYIHIQRCYYDDNCGNNECSRLHCIDLNTNVAKENYKKTNVCYSMLYK